MFNKFLQLTQSVNPQIIGVISSFACAITWVIAAVFISEIYKVPEIAGINSHQLPLAVCFLYGVFGTLFCFLFLKATNRIVEFKKTIKSSVAKILWLGGFCGGPAAMVLFCSALQNLDPAYAMPITSAYPVLCGVLAVIFLKEKINLLGWIGILTVIIGTILVGLKPPSHQSYDSFYLGVALSVGVAFAWSMEAICVSRGVDFVDPHVATAFRYLSYFFAFIFIIFPFMGGFEYIVPLLTYAFVPTLLAGFFSLVNCIFMYVGVMYLGSARSSAIITSYSLFSIFTSFVLGTIDLTFHLVFGGILLFLGILAIIKSSSNECYRSVDARVIPVLDNKLALLPSYPVKALITISIANKELPEGKTFSEIHADLLAHKVISEKIKPAVIASLIDTLELAGLLIKTVKNGTNYYSLTESGNNKLIKFL